MSIHGLKLRSRLAVAATCAAQLHAVQEAALREIAAAHWPEARKDVARAELQARMDGVEQRVAARISQVRLRTASASR
jgi:hypothetical protein